MFLVASGRHAGANLDGHQHGVPMQISINLGYKNFTYLPSFFSQILNFIYSFDIKQSLFIQ